MTLHSVVLALVLLFSSTIITSGDSNLRVQQAITKCRDKLLEDPTFPQAQHMLGMLLETTGSDLDEIAELSWQAGDCDDRPLETSKRVDALIRSGNTFSQLGHAGRAARAYQRALTLVEDPSMAETILHQVTPSLFREDRQTRTTIDSGMELANLASLLTAKFPLSPVTHQFQGAVSRKAGNVEDAFQSYHKATTLLSESDSKSATESYILATSAARQAGRNLETQLQYLQLALPQAGENNDLKAEVYNHMGIAYKSAGQTEAAIRWFQSALEAKPKCGHALAHLASLDAPLSATTFDADYVQGLIDSYSSRFEEELVHRLHYQGHEWVAQALVRLWERIPTTGITGTIVDLGVGSGLVGEALVRQLAKPPTLVGVDLSRRMVEMARGRTLGGNRIYQRVEQEDAETFLKGLKKESIDAVVAADVFIYIGELDGVVSASWKVLSPSGVLVFSAELAKEGMILLPSGRFGHSKVYIQDLAKRTGFNLKLWKEGILRMQNGAPVHGAVVVFQKNE